jgi:cytoskeletal protein RodZ
MNLERPAGDFGRTLREARERKGVTLRQIAGATKISAGVLEGLERNDISRLPGGIFGRAFVRSFASEVGLDPEVAIREFIAQFGGDPVVAAPPVRPVDGSAISGHRPRTAYAVAGVILVVAIVAALTIYLTFGRRASAATEVSPASPPEPAVAATSGAVSARSNDAAGEPDPPLVSAARRDEPRTDAVDPQRLVVSISATRQCWVRGTVDGQTRFAEVLQAGDRRDLEVRRDLILRIGDAGALTLTINGVDARPLGRSGEVVTARLDLRNFTTFLRER